MPEINADVGSVDFDPIAPVAEWNATVIELVIERGTLSDWRHLAREIRRDPWGRLARVVEAITAANFHYGIDIALTRVIAAARRDAARAAAVRSPRCRRRGQR